MSHPSVSVEGGEWAGISEESHLSHWVYPAGVEPPQVVRKA